LNSARSLSDIDRSTPANDVPASALFSVRFQEPWNVRRASFASSQRPCRTGSWRIISGW